MPEYLSNLARPERLLGAIPAPRPFGAAALRRSAPLPAALVERLNISSGVQISPGGMPEYLSNLARPERLLGASLRLAPSGPPLCGVRRGSRPRSSNCLILRREFETLPAGRRRGHLIWRAPRE